MPHQDDSRPHLSYVLAAMTGDEIDRAVAWLRQTPLGRGVEIVLAAPASVLSRVAGRVIPPYVRIASAVRPSDRKVVRVAGAQETTGLVVIVVDCDEDIAAKVGNSSGTARPDDRFENPATWVGTDGSASSRPALPPGVQPIETLLP